MRAAIYTEYGAPHLVRIVEIPKPVPGPEEILVRVRTSSITRTDCGFRSAEYFVSRFVTGLFKPRRQVLGCEYSGVVEAVGAVSEGFSVGDLVFGYDDERFGGHAEYIAVHHQSAVATLPEHISIEEAAAISEGAHYALWNIRASGIQAGQRALVYGATGAIGSAAVQLLHYFGVHVTAVCGTARVGLARSLGADAVIDYQTRDFAKEALGAGPFEFVFDAVGKQSFAVCKPLLTPRGVYISTELGRNWENVFLALLTPLLGGRRVMFPIPMTRREDILFLKSLVSQRAYRPVIDRVYEMSEIVQAYSYVERGQKLGNVLLRIWNGA